jgi:hypothetical protein
LVERYPLGSPNANELKEHDAAARRPISSFRTFEGDKPDPRSGFGNARISQNAFWRSIPSPTSE